MLRHRNASDVAGHRAILLHTSVCIEHNRTVQRCARVELAVRDRRRAHDATVCGLYINQPPAIDACCRFLLKRENVARFGDEVNTTEQNQRACIMRDC